MFSLINDHRNRLNFLLSMTVKLTGIIKTLGILTKLQSIQKSQVAILAIFLDPLTERHKNEILRKQK